MKATLTYEGKTVEVEIAEEEARKIFGKPKTGWEREFGGSYYSICDTGVLENLNDEDGGDGKTLYTCGNYFADEQLASDQARAISLWLRIKRWAAEHCEPVRWNNNHALKYCIYYNSSAGQIGVSNVSTMQDTFQVYFDTYESAYKCIQEFRDDLLWYFTKRRDRMDG